MIASRRPIALGAVGHLLLEITNNFLPVTYPLLIPLLGLSFTQVGLIALAHSFCGTLPQPWLGALAQRWGPQRIIVISLAWSGLFMGLIGLTGSYWLALVLAGLGGFGGGAFHPAGAMSVARIATGPEGRQRRGAAMSLFSVGGNLGSALSPALMAVALGLFGLPGTGAAVVVGLGSALLVWRLLAPRALASGDALPGLRIVNINPAVIDEFDLPVRARGVLVLAVRGPALRVGLRRGDIIRAVDGKPVAAVGDLVGLLRASRGTTEIGINRGGRAWSIRYRS